MADLQDMLSLRPSMDDSAILKQRSAQNDVPVNIIPEEEEQQMNKVLEIEKSFIDGGEKLLKPGRYLVKEGLLAKICRKVPKRRYFFLFNDILVYASVVSLTKRAFGQQRILSLEDMEVVLLADAELKNGMEIATTTKSFHVFASSAIDRDSWLDEFTRLGRRRGSVADAYHKSGGVVKFKAAVWVPDYQVEICMVCKSMRFTTFNRRHHCRSCGRVVCAACSEMKMVVQGLSDQKVRVCDECYDSSRTVDSQPTSPSSNRSVSPSQNRSQQQQQGNTIAVISPSQTKLPLSTSSSNGTPSPMPPPRPTRAAPIEKLERLKNNNNGSSNDIANDISDGETDRPIVPPKPAYRERSETATSQTSQSRRRPKPALAIPPKPEPRKRNKKKPEEGGIGNAIVILDYHPSPYDTDALSLLAGEKVVILERNDTGVWKGLRVRDKKTGMMPFRYLTEEEDMVLNEGEDHVINKAIPLSTSLPSDLDNFL